MTSSPTSTGWTGCARSAAEWSPERVAARHRHRRRPHPRAGPRTGRHRTRGGVRPNRLVQSGVRQPGQLARRRRQHPHRTLRRPRRSRCSRAPTAWSVTVQPIPGLEDGAPEFGRFRTRVRGAKEVLGQVPVSCLAEEIATPGEGQIKALITVAGNPVLSTPAGHKLDEVLPTLDAMIAVDLWLNETTRHADVILPAPSPLEQPHHDDLILNFAINSIANYSPPVFAPEEPGPPAGVGDPDPADRAVHRHARRGRRRRGDRRRVLRLHGVHPGPRRRRDPEALRRTGGPERILDLTLRTGPVRRPVRREPRRPHAGQAQGAAQRRQLRADGAAGSRGARHRGPQDPARPAVSARRSAAAGAATRPRTRRTGAGQPPASAVQQLVAAQRAAADEGQGSLHPADAPRRRDQAAAWRRATSSRLPRRAGTSRFPSR